MTTIQLAEDVYPTGVLEISFLNDESENRG